MSPIVKRLLFRVAVVIGALLGFALCGAALALTSKLLALAGLLCFMAACWVGLWTMRGLPSPTKTLRPFQPELFSPTALKLSESFGERLLWQSRPPLFTLWRWGVGYGALSCAIPITASLFGSKAATLLWIGGSIAVTIRITCWHRTLVCVTNRRILGISGLIEAKHISVPFGPCWSYQQVVDPVGQRLARMRLIAAPYGVLEVRSLRETDGVLRIGPVTYVESFAQLVRSRR